MFEIKKNSEYISLKEDARREMEGQIGKS